MKPALDPMRPDLILTNGKIVTADAAFSIVDAVAIAGGMFGAVGATDEIRALRTADTREIDLKGRTVLPGLFDTHCHVEAAGLADDTVSFDSVRSVADALARIRDMAARTAPGDWIRGQLWHPPSQLAEKRFLTAREIDTVAPEHPVYLPAGHFTMANGAAMRLAGIGKDTPDPPGGTIHRVAATGEPDGLFAEAAERLIEHAVPPWSRQTRIAQLRKAMAYFNSFGITSAISGAVSPADVDAYDQIRARGDATLRLGVMFTPTGELSPSIPVADWEAALRAAAAPAAFDDEWLAYAGAKLQVDGGMTLRTAAMRAPYPDDPDYRGECVIAPAELAAYVTAAHRAGWRVGIHAVGDAAIDQVLDAYEAADRERSIADRRFTLIHASLMRPDQMRRAQGLGVRADIQAPFLWTKAATIARFLGQENAESVMPARSMLDIMGLDSVGAGTDYPINPLNPFVNIYIMIARRDARGEVYGAGERISREEAIRLYTSAAARYSFAEHVKGSIEVGKLADLAVLSDDILTVPEAAVKDIAAVATIVGGRIVFGHDNL